jgi:hypothetical protein
VGKPSSRKIERATHEDVASRVLTGEQHQHHDCVAEFRKRHPAALAALFVQVLKLCEKAGLVTLGHVAIDGTNLRANASKHKAMSYGRMGHAEKKLAAEVKRRLKEAEQVDAQEDAEHGKGKRGDELPQELARRESRLLKTREAKAALEAEARERAEAEPAEARAKLEERAQGSRNGQDGRRQAPRSARPPRRQPRRQRPANLHRP